MSYCMRYVKYFKEMINRTQKCLLKRLCMNVSQNSCCLYKIILLLLCMCKCYLLVDLHYSMTVAKPTLLYKKKVMIELPVSNLVQLQVSPADY